MTPNGKIKKLHEHIFFRCPVQAESGDATLRIGFRKIPVQVRETSIDGFTIQVGPGASRRFKARRRWVLEYDGARLEVIAEWKSTTPEGNLQIGLHRLNDLTRPKPIKTSLLARYGGKRCEDPSFSAAIFGGFVLVLFSMMAMPGLGDSLGTAPRIQGILEWIVRGLDQSIGPYL